MLKVKHNETLKHYEMLWSEHTDLVKYEYLTRLSRVKPFFVKRNETLQRYEMLLSQHTELVKYEYVTKLSPVKSLLVVVFFVGWR